MKRRKSSLADRGRGAVLPPVKSGTPSQRERSAPSSRPSSHDSQSSRRAAWRRGGLLLLLLAFILVGGLVWRLAPTNPSPQAIQEAVRLANRGRFVEAEPLLRRGLEIDPQNVELLRALTEGLFAAKRLSDAEAVLTQWCQVQPATTEPFRLRMDLRHNNASQFKPGDAQDRLKEMALADGLQILKIAPDDNTTAKKVVWLCLAAGRFEEAERICGEHLKLHPNDPELLFQMARVYHSQGANLPAQQVLNQLLKLRPDDASALLLLGVLHYEADESEQAIPLLQRVLAQSGGAHKEARYHLSLALARAGHATEAQRLMAEVQLENFERDTARDGQPDGLPVRVRRAELLLACGRDAQAIAELQAILKTDPDNAAALRLLANADVGRGESYRESEPAQ